MYRSCLGALIVFLAIVAPLALTPTPAGATSENGPEIAGRSAIVIDATTGSILYEQDARKRLAPASLTKLFTAYFAIESTPLQRRMAVVKDDLVGEASAGLSAGENLSFETLLHGLLLVSGNDAAMTIARNVGESRSPSSLNGVTSFAAHMNSRIAALGLTDTNLVNPHGLDAAGHYSSAHDIAAITMLALQTEPEFLSALAAGGYEAEGYAFPQRNQIASLYPGGIGGKTGITDDAGFCLMTIAHRDGRTIISVVLGSTQDAWYNDSMALLDAGFATPTTTSLPAISLAAPRQTATLATAPAALAGMVVNPASDSISVQSGVTVPGTSWNVLRWPIATMLAMIVAFVVVVQLRALAELQKRPRARGMRPRTRRPAPARTAPDPHVPAGTQPFTTVSRWDRSVAPWSAGAGD